jgi:hypothetical protein
MDAVQNSFILHGLCGRTGFCVVVGCSFYSGFLVSVLLLLKKNFSYRWFELLLEEGVVHELFFGTTTTTLYEEQFFLLV